MDIPQPTFTAATPPQQQQYNIWAILGFVFALLAFPFGIINPIIALLPVLLGIIFAIIALRQIKRNPQLKGRGLALAGIIIAVIVAVSVVVFLWWLGHKVLSVQHEAQLKLTDTEIISAAKDQQSLADDAYTTYKNYPNSTQDNSLDTSGLIGLVAGINPYKSFMLFNPTGVCSTHQDQYGYFPYKSLASKGSCHGGDKGDCQAYEIRFCLQQASGEFKAGDNVISRDGPPPPSPAVLEDTRRIADMNQFQAALARYHSDHGTYPYAENNVFYPSYKLCETGFVTPEKICTITYSDHIPIPQSVITHLWYNTDSARSTYNIQFDLSQPQGNLSRTNCARPSGITSGACPNRWQNQPGE